MGGVQFIFFFGGDVSPGGSSGYLDGFAELYYANHQAMGPAVLLKSAYDVEANRLFEVSYAQVAAFIAGETLDGVPVLRSLRDGVETSEVSISAGVLNDDQTSVQFQVTETTGATPGADYRVSLLAMFAISGEERLDELALDVREIGG